jgi:hypothetical protein
LCSADIFLVPLAFFAADFFAAAFFAINSLLA